MRLRVAQGGGLSENENANATRGFIAFITTGAGIRARAGGKNLNPNSIVVHPVVLAAYLHFFEEARGITVTRQAQRKLQPAQQKQWDKHQTRDAEEPFPPPAGLGLSPAAMGLGAWRLGLAGEDCARSCAIFVPLPQYEQPWNDRQAVEITTLNVIPYALE